MSHPPCNPVAAPTGCPVEVPDGFQLFHGVKTDKGINYNPPIPIGDVNVRKWVFTWSGVGQWVTPQFMPMCEHWVAIPKRRK